VDHLRSRRFELVRLLEDVQVLAHPFVIGELACGSLKNRATVLGFLRALPQAVVAEHDEVLVFIERHGLGGTGIGLIDVHLLASARLMHASLWTMDRRLAGAARALDLAWAE
jgi:hypothetical protein